jgi:hypothetical protein
MERALSRGSIACRQSVFVMSARSTRIPEPKTILSCVCCPLSILSALHALLSPHHYSKLTQAAEPKQYRPCRCQLLRRRRRRR